jgi:hypothetical protein
MQSCKINDHRRPINPETSSCLDLAPFHFKENGEEPVSVKIRALLSFFISINFFLPFCPYFYTNRLLSISFEMERILLHLARVCTLINILPMADLGGEL